MANYAHPETLVDTQWLSQHLDDPNIAIIEMDMNSEAYDNGHIPGSIFWNAFALTKPDLSINLDKQAVEEFLAHSGITNNTTVIAVNGSFIATSGLIFWLLKLFGHSDVRILNGGRQKWVEEDYPLTTKATVIEPASYQAKTLDESLRISLEEVKQSLNQDDCLLLDVRTPQEYCGEIFMMEPPKENERGGHIPGAINLNYQQFHNNDGTFKSAAELKAIFAEQGATADRFIIPYCAVGARSGHTWFILKYLLDYPQVKNYDGSWNEWSRELG